MKRLLIFTGLSTLLLATSCEKHNLLLKERQQIEADIKRGNDELQALDAKFAALGVDPFAAATTMERQHASWLVRISQQEQELAYLSKKCSDGEEGLKSLRPRIDSYKARFAR